ncbi:MAG TPA: ABC transporter ATP-binding protein [Pyrinomonadaceae bacterium]|jgi:cobalt/nickel transport system ATP-binding protein|nr:ABC transporter ATP-binding protein [Pyrinomonadaceae bacterium]
MAEDESEREVVFEAREVIFRYQEAKALDGLSLTVRRGERVAILGANGSGKSTYLRLLDGLYFPADGTVTAFGRELSEDVFGDEEFAFDFRRRVGLIFQNPDVQLFNPTVFDELAFGPLQLRWPQDRVRRQVSEVLDLMEISHLKDRPPHRLSGGEKKRVALASVLVLDPEVLLLDEPTAALDPKSQSQVIDFLVGWAGGAKTVITTTHDLDIVEDIADRCCIFQHGRVIADGAPEELLRDEELLRRTNLIHAHRHAHASGEIHSHPHRHRAHEH